MNYADLSIAKPQSYNRIWTNTLARYLVHPILLVGLITGVGAILRLYNLGRWSFWIDEVFTLKSIRVFDPVDPPRFTYYLVEWATLMFGTSEWSARLIPSLIGIITIPILYLLVRQMFGHAPGIMASLLLAIAPWHLYWSQNARHYILLILFVTLTLCFILLGLKKNNLWLLGLAGLFLVLAVWEHATALMAILIIAGYLLFVLIVPWQKPPGLTLRNIVILAGVTAIFAIPLVIFTLPSQLQQSDTIQTYEPNNNPIWIVVVITYYVRVPVILAGILGGVYLLLNRQSSGVLLGLWAVVPAFVMAVLSLFSYTATRYAAISLPAWIILASVCTVELFRKTSGTVPKLLILVLPLILVADSLGEDMLYHRYHNGNRDDWKSAFQYIEAHQQPDDLVFVTKSDIGQYYLRRPVLEFQDLEEALSKSNTLAQRAWIVEDLNIGTVSRETLAWTHKNAHLAAQFDNEVGGRNFIMRVYFYDPQDPPPNFDSPSTN